MLIGQVIDMHEKHLFNIGEIRMPYFGQYYNNTDYQNYNYNLDSNIIMYS